LEQLLALARALADPRAGNASHPYVMLVMGIVLATAANFRGASGIARWFRWNFEELDDFLETGQTPPSRATVRRALESLDEGFLDKALLGQGCPEGFVAMDGKAVRAACRPGSDAHDVSAFHAGSKAAVAVVRVSGKGHEKEGFLELARRVGRPGVVFSMDAGGLSRELCKAVKETGADWMVAVKGNAALLETEAWALFEDDPDRRPRRPSFETLCKGHGRLETRTHRTADARRINLLDPWPGLACVGLVERRREILGGRRKGHVSREMAMHAMSFDTDAKGYAGLARGHWSVESSLHHVLDATLGEDSCRLLGKAGAALAKVRRVALSLLRRLDGFPNVAAASDFAACSPAKFWRAAL